jgi:hypothetical protein
MDLGFLDNVWQGIGNFGADADQFMKREMPFDSGWGAPAALVASYFAAPYVASMGAAEGAGALGGASEGAGALGGEAGAGGGFLDGFGSLFGGNSSGGFGLNPSMGSGVTSTGFGTTEGSTFGGLNPNMGAGVTSNGFGTTTGSTFGGLNPSVGMSDSITSSGLGDLSPSSGFNSKSFQQQLGRQLMQGNMGNMGGSRQGYQYQEQPVQRQAAFAPTPPPFQVQDKSDIAALVAALRSKGTM